MTSLGCSADVIFFICFSKIRQNVFFIPLDNIGVVKGTQAEKLNPREKYRGVPEGSDKEVW